MAAASSRRPLEEKTGSVISPRVASSGLPCFALLPVTGEVTPPPKKYCMTETMARPGGASHDAVEPGAPAMSQSLAQNVTKKSRGREVRLRALELPGASLLLACGLRRKPRVAG